MGACNAPSGCIGVSEKPTHDDLSAIDGPAALISIDPYGMALSDEEANSMAMEVARRFNAFNSPMFDLVAHIRRQRDFSERTFGPGQRTEGVLDHIRKELAEIAQKPTDLYEWVDVILLALDGAWRAGYEPEHIADAINRKQDKNELRDWPYWRTVDPSKAIEHVRHIVADDVGGAK